MSAEEVEDLVRRRLSRRQLLNGGAALGAGFAAASLVGVDRVAAAERRMATALIDVARGVAPAQAGSAPAQALQAWTILPPGQSGFFSLAGLAKGRASGLPSDFGAHVDDQRGLYWNLQYKPGAFQQSGTPESPIPGVRVYRDSYGVPAIYADTAHDLWFGAGYASAADRLFQMDLFRRAIEGRMAELMGPSAVPSDIQARVLGYSDAEYQAFFDTLSAEAQQAVQGYVDGVNAWLAKVQGDSALLPAEYVLLSSTPEAWTVKDTLAVSVLIIRSVASGGGDEFELVKALRALEAKYGTAAGRQVFQDFFWLEDRLAATTIPASSGTFDSRPAATSAEREQSFQAMADYADSLPLELAEGPGTGAAPAPGTLTSQANGRSGTEAAPARAVAAILEWAKGLHGGSYQIAVAPQRTKDGHALLVSAPQLGYSYPGELVELEVHGAGYDAHGISVAGVPVVGIGYGQRAAWALTSGLSKTIDSFIETVRPNPKAGGPAQYLHNGAWHDMACRTETVRYRGATHGIPTGSARYAVAVQVCRTVHGPVVATSADGSLARSVQLAIWGRELRTLEGMLGWDRAQNLSEFAASVARVSWNENVMYADADGHIAYWHPGLYPLRSRRVDQRLPAPGTGEYDWAGFLPFDRMPHVVDPPQGFLANWNNKPAVGWAGNIAAGPANRVQNITDQLAARSDFSFADLVGIDRRTGTLDVRAQDFLPFLMQLRLAGDLTAHEAAALDALAWWDGSAFGPAASTSADGATDGPAPTIFAAFMDALRAQLFGDLPADVLALAKGGHPFDVSPLDNMALRVFIPSSSSLTASRDYAAGRTPLTVTRAALDDALQALSTQYGTADVSAYRRPHPRSKVCSLTGGIVGPCLTMPQQDRGSYIQLVGFTSDSG